MSAAVVSLQHRAESHLTCSGIRMLWAVFTWPARIYTDAGLGWTDASGWYWAASEEAGPWWAVTIAEKEEAIAAASSLR
ncbi:MAG: hypothetical protein WKF30_04525 [Pyrinomonadaceae bacterium]